MNEEIKEDNNCIVKAFQTNPISILKENIDNKKIYYFKASDIGKALGIVNIRSTIQNYDERVIRNVYDPQGTPQDTIFLTSQGVYRLLYNSKKEIAKKFRKWAGNILDDIIFNESAELKRQIEEKDQQLQEQNKFIEELELKPETEGFLSREAGELYVIKDNNKPGHIKIGMGFSSMSRVEQLNVGSSCHSLQIYTKFKTFDRRLAEKLVHNLLLPFRIKNRQNSIIAF